jgi:hypothetical protein
MMKEGTTVDARVSEAPPSIKNEKNSRDPDMDGNREGNGWHAGVDTHASVEAASRRVHSMAGTATCRSNVLQAHALSLADGDYPFATRRFWPCMGKTRTDRARCIRKGIKSQTNNIMNRLSSFSH